jgi:hypothetical protein
MHPLFTNIGSYIKTVINAFSATTSTAVTGAAIQIVGPGYQYKSGQLALYLGTVTGAPSALSVVAKIQHSADGSTNWTDFTDPYGVGSVTNAAASTEVNQNVVLQGAQAYIRLVVTPSFTGGTTPAIPLAGAIVLGGTSEYPAV